jgi:hypothetical protein
MQRNVDEEDVDEEEEEEDEHDDEEEYDVIIEEGDDDINCELVDLSKFDKDSLKKLKGTSLRHFNKFLSRWKAQGYEHINLYKQRVTDEPADALSCLAKSKVIGHFADHLMKKTKIKKNTCLAYLSAIKSMLMDDFKAEDELSRSGWYKKTRKNVFSGYDF